MLTHDSNVVSATQAHDKQWDCKPDKRPVMSALSRDYLPDMLAYCARNKDISETAALSIWSDGICTTMGDDGKYGGG